MYLVELPNEDLKPVHEGIVDLHTSDATLGDSGLVRRREISGGSRKPLKNATATPSSGSA